MLCRLGEWFPYCPSDRDMFPRCVQRSKKFDSSPRSFAARHLLELFARPFALVLFFEAAELQRISFAADRVHVVDEEQVLSVLVPLFGMIPERAGVLDELAGFCR